MPPVQYVGAFPIPVYQPWSGHVPATGPALVIVQGLPGSGKTTFTETVLFRYPDTVRRVSRDHLRRMLFDSPYQPESPDREAMVTAVQAAAVDLLLANGYVAIVDDTNLNRNHLASMVSRIGPIYRSDIRIIDFTGIPVTECIQRDAERPEAERVGADVITGMWNRWLEDQPPTS
jgi:predicted kinase